MLTSVIDQFKIMKRQFSEKYGILFDTAQILFILPLNWTEEQYKDKLHAFLLETEWITPKDNEKKLILIPFISILTETFKVMQKRHLDRERTSLLFAMQPTSEDDKVELSYTYFQMQSAKELIAVSKTLASSDYLLVPSIKSSNSIYLANFQNVMFNAVKQILIGGKHSKDVSDGSAADEDELIRKMVCFLPSISDSAEWDYNKSLDSCAWSVDWDKHQLQDLKSWSCGQFISTLMEDVNIKQYFKQVSDFLKGSLLEYGATKHSPDGIQHVLLYSHFEDQRQDFRHFIKQVLIKEDIILPRDEFIDINTWFSVEYAMQKPYKMIQIANAVLPPVIVNEDTQDDSVFRMDTRSDNLIAPNSFYVQANITDTHTSFILNKVVALPSSKNAAKLFTVQERSVEIEDITETVSHLLWNHYQSISDDKENRHSLFNSCRKHDDIALSFSHYKQFKKGIKELVGYWLETKDTPTSEGLDTYHLVSVIDEQCVCTLNLSRRLLLEVGLKPVIANIAATVTSSLFSNDFFGRYQVSALIVKKDLKTINNPHFSYSYSRFLKEALQRHLRVHQRRISLLFHDNQVDSKITQYLGRGEYSQVSSTTWIFKFDMSPGRAGSSTLGVEEGSGCKRIPALPYASNREGDASMSRYIALTRGEDLPLAGINRNLLLKDCDQLGLGRQTWSEHYTCRLCQSI
ncbi:unnamed protein product [Mucor circinelloides]